MGIQVYNTLTRQKEPFQPLEDRFVRMYVCGPTVYDKAHLGHAMSVLVYDIIRRYLEYRGYTVRHVMNYTDVDDKIIRRARELGEDPMALAEHYIEEFDRHMRELGLLQPHVKPRVSQEIPWILRMVEGLVEKGYAYVLDNGDVYFHVPKKADYGKLSGRKLEDLQEGFRIEPDPRKKHPADFALWKAAKPGEPWWESPWGPGRPGWHIECSAMNLHHLGEQLDIHGGGQDLIFPHHENEIAQSEAYTGKAPYVKYWLHNGLLMVGDSKMAKSEGNFVTIDDFLREHEADVLRMMVLQSHYRRPLVFSDATVHQARAALERLRSAMRPAFPQAQGLDSPQAHVLREHAVRARAAFQEAMDDDFNTAEALAALFTLVRHINQARDAGATDEQLQPAQMTLLELGEVFGLTLVKEGPAHDVAPFIELLLEVRQRLRQEKRWDLSDFIRDQLAQLGIQLEDTPQGTLWRWK